MKAALAFVHITIAYLLLRGWPDALPAWLRAALALIVIMLALPLREKQKPTHQRKTLICLRRPHWMDFLYIGAVIVVIELFLLSVFTIFPKEAETLAKNLHGWVTTQSQTAPSEQEMPVPNHLSTNGKGNWLWDNHSQRPLSTTARKHVKNKPNIFIDMLNEKNTQELKKTQIYIKSFSLDYFDGVRWSIHRPTKFTLSKRGTQKLTLHPHKLNKLPTYKARITQSFHTDGQNVFCAIQNPLTTEIDNLTKINTDTFLLPQLPLNNITYNYTTTSQPLNFNQILKLDKQLSPASPPAIDSIYLSQINDYELQQKIAQLAKTIPQDLSMIDKLLRIRQLIRKQCSYSLEIKNPNHLNPLSNFLFHAREGHCEHFATATAMLCREHQIPSRITYGWTGGKHFMNSNLFVFLSKNAHAWTEIYLRGYGWVIFDTTPSAHLQDNLTSNEPAPQNIEKGNAFKSTNFNSHLDPVPPELAAWKIPIAILCIGSLFTSLVLLLRKFSTSPRSSYGSTHLPSKPPKYLLLFEKLCSQLGHPPRTGATLAQTIHNLKTKTDTLDQQQLNKLLNYHYDITYRNRKPSKKRESSILKFLKHALAKTPRYKE